MKQVIALLSLWALLGCEVSSVEPDTPHADAPGLRTTDGARARQNLSAQIEGLRHRVSLDRRDIVGLERLVGVLLQRARSYGMYRDWDEVAELLEQAPSGPGVRLLRAQFLTEIHRFDQAKEVLLESPSLLLSHEVRARGLLDALELHTGAPLERLLKKRLSRAKEAPSFESKARVASVLAASGSYERADTWYLDALASYDEVSPFPVAMVSFQRGLMWSEFAGKPDVAPALYEEAIARLPGYVVAHVHRAELQGADAAVEQLAPVARETQDPEAAARMAELLAPSAPVEAAAWLDIAASRYEDLLARYPEAFADHGAEFYLAQGQDVERAMRLALQNLEQRRTDRAWGLAIRAARAARESALVCELARDIGRPVSSVPVQMLVQEVLARCSVARGPRVSMDSGR